MIWRSLTGRDYSILDVFVAAVFGSWSGSGELIAATVLLIGWAVVMLFQRQP